MDSHSYWEGFKHLARGRARKKSRVNAAIITPSTCAMTGHVWRPWLHRAWLTRCGAGAGLRLPGPAAGPCPHGPWPRSGVSRLEVRGCGPGDFRICVCNPKHKSSCPTSYYIYAREQCTLILTAIEKNVKAANVLSYAAPTKGLSGSVVSFARASEDPLAAPPNLKRALEGSSQQRKLVRCGACN